MRHLSRLIVLAAVGVGAAVLTSSAFAARPTALQLPDTIGSTHFLVHFQTNPVAPAPISATQAGDLASLAERAYSAEIADGFTAPPSDGALGGDGRIDLYVADLASFGGALAVSIPDNGTSPDSGCIMVGGYDARGLVHDTRART